MAKPRQFAMGLKSTDEIEGKYIKQVQIHTKKNSHYKGNPPK